MMSTTPKLVRSVSTRSIKKVDKPKPLKSLNPLLLSASYSLDDLVSMINSASQCISHKNYSELSGITAVLTPKLRNYGQRIEEAYKDQLDKAFVNFRNGCREDEIDFSTRLNLLHLVELRAMSWHSCASMNQFYVYRGSNVEEPNDGNLSPQLVGAQPILNPGEVIKSSGKFSSPTKMPGKNYCKDEVVIRNADSGKVMGIRGRRVHMIEELSETVISFQRVSPGAKERLVQITGPDSDKIEFARQLMEDTIKRNASPVRELEKDAMGSTSSLNSTASEESAKFINTGVQDFKYSHTVHHRGKTLFLASTDLEFLEESKLKLESCFNAETQKTPSDRVKPFTEEEVKPAASSTPEPNVSLTAAYIKAASPPKNVKIVPVEKQDSVGIVEVKEKEPSAAIAAEPSESAVKHKYEYDRSFLLECASSASSKAEPIDFQKILREFPMVAQTVAQIFEASAYLHKWNSRQVVTISNLTGDIDSD